MAAGCGGGGSEATCGDVSAAVLQSIEVDGPASFTSTDVELGSGTAFYVSTADGATWATNIDPESASSGAGLTLPMNRAARSASQVGVDANPTAPIFDGLDNDSSEAQASRDCAAAG